MRTLDGDENVPIVYSFVCCHVVFYAKMEDFFRKAHFVAGGHMIDIPATMTYICVITCENVCLALVISELNDLDVRCGDVMYAYITAQFEEQIWTTLGTEFGPDAGKRELFVCALYCLKSFGAAFRAHLGQCMKGLRR